MLSLPASVRIYVCTQPVDMRRSFDGLVQLTREVIGQDPLSGHLFLFRSRRGDRLKLLYWERDGLVIWYKRLEQGTFAFPVGDAGSVELSATELALLLEGIEPASVRRRPRYTRPGTAPR